MFKNKLVWCILILVAFIYLNNSSRFIKQRPGNPLLLAHRGLAQTFRIEGLTNETNTARRIYPPEHPFLENTIPSMAAAFQHGADIVEFDILPTKDGRLAVFHDWTLEYRTNGRGMLRDYTMAELKLLDVGYGYTADEGRTFPFRGRGVGLIPSMEEVLVAFPDASFLIHIKTNDDRDGERLAEYLATLSEPRRGQLAVYGGDQPIARLHEQLPKMRVMSKATLKKALLTYMAVGWTGYIPRACRNTQLHLPIKYARFLWGWPRRFLRRMDRVNTRVVLVEGDGQFSEGFDSVADLKKLPPGYTGVIWTNRIDRIGPAVK